MIPYERDFTLIGTTDQDFTAIRPMCGRARRRSHICAASTSAYLRKPVTPDMVVWSYSGRAAAVRRRSVGSAGGDPGLRAETRCAARMRRPCFRSSAARSRPIGASPKSALAQLQPHLPAAVGRGGRVDRHGRRCRAGTSRCDGFEAQVGSRGGAVSRSFPSRRCAGWCGLTAHGSIDCLVMQPVYADLGTVFGADLTEAELRYLVQRGMGADGRRRRLAAQQARAATDGGTDRRVVDDRNAQS